MSTAVDRWTLYRAGFLDAFDGLPPAWLGIDGYRLGYEGGLRAAAPPARGVLVGASDDGLERCYLVGGAEVHVAFDRREAKWRASVPGYSGGFEISVDGALSWIRTSDLERAGRWLSEGRALHGFGGRIVFTEGAR